MKEEFIKYLKNHSTSVEVVEHFKFTTKYKDCNIHIFMYEANFDIDVFSADNLTRKDIKFMYENYKDWKIILKQLNNQMK